MDVKPSASATSGTAPVTRPSPATWAITSNTPMISSVIDTAEDNVRLL
jgi:hypothetical protein